MSEFVVAVIVCLCVMSGAALGILLRNVLPPEHMSEPSRNIVNVAIGLVATLAALVLGLLVASAKSSFDARNDEVKQSATRLVVLDRTLRQYGPDAKSVRELVRELTQQRIDRRWNKVEDVDRSRQLRADAAKSEAIRGKLFELTPANDAQRWLLGRALVLTSDIEQARWLLVETDESSIPAPFLVVLVFWLAAIFCALGLFSPRNATVYVVLAVCAISVSTAILMILEMDQPFEGLLQVSNSPLTSAVEEMRQ